MLDSWRVTKCDLIVKKFDWFIVSRRFKGSATRGVQGSCLGKLYFNNNRH